MSFIFRNKFLIYRRLFPHFVSKNFLLCKFNERVSKHQIGSSDENRHSFFEKVVINAELSSFTWLSL